MGLNAVGSSKEVEMSMGGGVKWDGVNGVGVEFNGRGISVGASH